MKKGIHFDRMRRKAIMDGSLTDIEHLASLSDDLYTSLKGTGREEQGSFDKINKLTQMLGNLTGTGDE